MGTDTVKNRKEWSPQDAYDAVSMGLEQLKGLIASAGLLMESQGRDYVSNNVSSALGLVEEWIDGIIEDLDDVLPEKENLLTQCKRAQKTVAGGVLGLHGNLAHIKEVVEAIDCFLNDDLGQIIKIRQKFEETAAEITRKLHNGTKAESKKAA